MFEEEDNIPVQIRPQTGTNKLSVQHDIFTQSRGKQLGNN